MPLRSSASMSSAMKKRFRTEIYFSPRACIFGALMLLVFPLHLLLAALCAAVVHELCHLAVLHLFKAPIHSIRIDIGGATIVTAPLPPVQELLCACAGPSGSFLCLLFIRKFPLLAFCGLVQGAYNLLPLYPMDGGRILRCTAELTLPKYADKLCQIVSFTMQAAIVCCSLFMGIRFRLLIFPFIGLTICARSALPRNRPCKSASLWVQ